MSKTYKKYDMVKTRHKLAKMKRIIFKDKNERNSAREYYQKYLD